MLSDVLHEFSNLVMVFGYSCRYSEDVILVYDGKDSMSPLIAQLCNRQSFVQIISSGPDLYIQFKTGSSPTIYDGFKASYRFESNQTNSQPMSPITTSTITPDGKESAQIPPPGINCINQLKTKFRFLQIRQ